MNRTKFGETIIEILLKPFFGNEEDTPHTQLRFRAGHSCITIKVCGYKESRQLGFHSLLA